MNVSPISPTGSINPQPASGFFILNSSRAAADFIQTINHISTTIADALMRDQHITAATNKLAQDYGENTNVFTQVLKELNPQNNQSLSGIRRIRSSTFFEYIEKYPTAPTSMGNAATVILTALSYHNNYMKSRGYLQQKLNQCGTVAPAKNPSYNDNDPDDRQPIRSDSFNTLEEIQMAQANIGVALPENQNDGALPENKDSEPTTPYLREDTKALIFAEKQRKENRRAQNKQEEKDRAGDIMHQSVVNRSRLDQMRDATADNQSAARHDLDRAIDLAIQNQLVKQKVASLNKSNEARQNAADLNAKAQLDILKTVQGEG